jgi:hypothetical protein
VFHRAKTLQEGNVILGEEALQVLAPMQGTVIQLDNEDRRWKYVGTKAFACLTQG